MSGGPQADQVNLTYMSTEFMNYVLRACHPGVTSIHHAGRRAGNRSAHERDVNLVGSCSRGHSPQNMGTTAPRTVCPAPGNRVHGGGIWVPDRQILVQKVVLAGHTAIGGCALSSREDRWSSARSPHTPCPPKRPREARRSTSRGAFTSVPPPTGRQKLLAHTPPPQPTKARQHAAAANDAAATYVSVSPCRPQPRCPLLPRTGRGRPVG
jgi:hypothetical protein